MTEKQSDGILNLEVLSIPPKQFIQGKKIRVYPTEKQEQILVQYFGVCRKVHNFTLGYIEKRYKDYSEGKRKNKPVIDKGHWCKILSRLKKKKGNEFLNIPPTHSLQIMLHTLAESYSNFLSKPKQIGKPNFKSKKRNQSIPLTWKYGFNFKEKKLVISKIDDPFKIKYSGTLPLDHQYTARLTRNNGGVYELSMVFNKTSDPIQTGEDSVGIDLGIKTLLSLSDGSEVKNPKQYLKAHKRIKILQQSISRKYEVQKKEKRKEPSKNIIKARKLLAKAWWKYRNVIEDFTHKLSTGLVEKFQFISIEDLSIKNMLKNRKLARTVMFSGWGRLITQLKYKVQWTKHCVLGIASRWYPSTQTCSSCGMKSKEKITLGIRSWTCEFCDSFHDRDTNAAKNLERLLMLHFPNKNPDKLKGNIIKLPLLTEFNT